VFGASDEVKGTSLEDVMVHMSTYLVGCGG